MKKPSTERFVGQPVQYCWHGFTPEEEHEYQLDVLGEETASQLRSFVDHAWKLAKVELSVEVGYRMVLRACTTGVELWQMDKSDVIKLIVLPGEIGMFECLEAIAFTTPSYYGDDHDAYYQELGGATRRNMRLGAYYKAREVVRQVLPLQFGEEKSRAAIAWATGYWEERTLEDRAAYLATP